MPGPLRFDIWQPFAREETTFDKSLHGSRPLPKADAASKEPDAKTPSPQFTPVVGERVENGANRQNAECDDDAEYSSRHATHADMNIIELRP